MAALAAPRHGLLELFASVERLAIASLRGDVHAARVGAIFYRRLNDLAVLPAFAGFSVEVGDVFQTRSDISLSDARLGGSFLIGVDTPIGPVYAAYGRAEAGEGAFYLFLGRIF